MTHSLQSRAFNSLNGLSVGDAFGECFFSISSNPLSLQMHLETQTLPNPKWRWTDDTAMAISIVEMLLRDGSIDQDQLSQGFANRYAEDDRRGYGGTAHGILMKIGAGLPWRDVSREVLGGAGSMGNGAAMRVAPLGAFFADETTQLVDQAQKSAEITHAHPEGIAGAIAVALAAGYMAAHTGSTFDRDEFFAYILNHAPDSITRAKCAQARDLPPNYSVQTVTSVVGNGSTITAPETVPFCLWCVANHPTEFEQAMWTAVAAGGDIDTNCAIVGGILCANPQLRPPPDWLARREVLPRFNL